MIDFNYDSFAGFLGASESGNNYNPGFNGIAYGRYQFTPSTIARVANELNITVPSISDFISNPTMQDTFYKQYVNDILNYIESQNLTQFIGKSITDTKGNTAIINIYGLVAGAWLGGLGGLVTTLLSLKNPSDLFGTHVSDYIVKFSNYKIDTGNFFLQSAF